MYAVATCLGSILRGTTVDQFGDQQDTGLVVRDKVPAAIRETSHTVFDPATQTPRVVRSMTAAVQSDVDIRDEDQFRDDTNGVLYAVVAVTQPGGPGRTRDLQVQLQRVNGQGTA